MAGASASQEAESYAKNHAYPSSRTAFDTINIILIVYNDEIRLKKNNDCLRLSEYLFIHNVIVYNQF